MENEFYAMICFMCFIITTIEIYQCFMCADKSDRWKVFIVSMVAMDVGFLADMFYGLYRAELGGGILAYGLNHIYTISVTMGIYFWFVYSEWCQDMQYIQSKRNRLLLMIPHLLVIAVGCSGYAYYLDGTGFHRGPLYAVQLCVDFVYIIFTGTKAIYRALLRENYGKKKEYLSLAYFLIFPIAFATAQSVTGGAIPMQGAGTVIGYILVFQAHQERMISTDPMTGLNNRNNFVQFLSRKMKNHTKLLYLMMIDADKFKKINDTYGHAAGDLALNQIADALKRSVPDNFILARFGGDEFVAAGEAADENLLKTVGERIHSALADSNRENGRPWDVTVSIGYAVYSPQMKTIPDFIEAADAELYRVKRSK